MSLTRAIIATLNLTLAALALVGLALRGRVGVSYSFSGYLLGVALAYASVLLGVDTASPWAFQLATGVTQRGLVFAAVIEIAAATYRPLPVGRRLVGRIFAIIAVVTLALLALTFEMPANAAEWTLVAERVSYGTAFLFIAFLALSGYYYVPIDPLHREIALGFVLISFLVAFAHALSRYDDLMGLGHYSISAMLYPLILLGWVWSAWRPRGAR